ncbi:copper homeostasis protein cutC homolog isoform X2 [Ostrea edulis]|nr:copper homeostasis protein cutC homolog isoform X2 [Ostrea edulis]XP_048744212.2 copper homeostasis protein cutC homolog isoform X2 [Ostrea edulis]XP_048744213.2 copper homeostasis protein cutC homolog isoform X2 [Ostrea edulis]
MLKTIKKYVKIPVFVMLRPRGGDFLYSSEEIEVMKSELVDLKEAGADGFVFGCLNEDGTVDKQLCSKFLDLIRPLPATFHRAIDMTSDILQALDDVVDLGFQRVLTSGGSSSALEGLPMIQQMVERAGDRTCVMPGGGINSGNLNRILDGCGAKEFHGSARATLHSKMSYRKEGITMGAALCPPEFSVKVTDKDKVLQLVHQGHTHKR